MSDYMDSLYSGLNDESLEAITAALGYNDGANKGFWRKQPRKKWGKGAGQWIEMGARLRALFKIDGKLQSVTGRSAGSDGTANGVRFLPDANQPGVDSNKIYGVDTAHLEEIQATLPDNYVESKGLDAKREQTGTGNVVSTANIPDIADMETADVTPDDVRMVEEGVNSVEGQEAEGFKNTDEGKQVASLDDVDESDVLTGEEVNKLVDGTEAANPLAEARLEKVSDEEMAKLGLADSGFNEYTQIGEGEARFGIENKGGGNWEFYNYSTGEIFPVKANSLEEVESELADYWLERGNYDPDRLQGAEDETKANARGFTETMRSSLRGMKGRAEGGFAKALANGRTATIVKDTDGSWHLEKHDEFNGGIQETKRFEDGFFSSGLDAALAEGDAYLNDNIAKKMTRKEFGDYVDNRYNDAERSKPAFLDEAAIDEAYNTYSDYHDESKSDNGWVTKDMDADARSEAFSEMDDIAVADEKAPLGDVEELIKDAMGGKNVDLGQWLEGKDEEPKADSGSEEEDGDESDPDFTEPELEFENDNPDDELLKDIASKDRDEAENVAPGDVIMGQDGMPIRVKTTEWDETDGDEESPGLTITGVDGYGNEQSFRKGRYDSVFYPNFAEGTTAKPQSVKPATPVAPKAPAKPARIAPDSAFEADAGRVQIGDKLYSNDGSTLLGEVTQTRKKGGKTEARLSLDGKDEGFQELGPVNLVDRNPDVAAKKQAEKDAKKAEAARAKAEKKAADEKAAADKEAAVNDPRTDEGIENLKSILEGANNPERLQPAIDVLNDDSLSNDQKAEKLVEALTTKLGFLNGTDEQRMGARKAEQKAMSLLEKAGIPGSTMEERKAASAKRQSRSSIQSDSALKFPESNTLASEVADMKKRLDAGEDVPVEETDALNAKIADHRKRFWMRGDSNGKPLAGESERVDEEIRKAQREGTAPIPFVRQDGTEIRPDDTTAAPASTTTTPAGVTPTPPKPVKPIRKQPKPKPIGTPDDDGKPIDGGNKSTADIAKMRERKLQNAIDENGDPVYEKDLDGNLVLDKKGRPKPVQDTDAILAALRADYPDAKLDSKGNIVVHREDYVGADGKPKRLELLVHKNTGGKIGISMAFTDLDSGEVEQLIHHDERDSYMGLHGKTNGIQALLDITRGGSPANERRTATRGYSTEGKTDFRERAEYFVRQGRLLTHEQVWEKYLDGYAEEINTSAGGRGVNKGKAYLTLRRKGVPSAAEALREGDRYTFFQRVRAAAGHTPVTPEGRAALRKSVRDYLGKEMPELSPRERTVLAQYVDRSMQGQLVDPKGRENPFSSRETKSVKPGDWVDYTNNVGEVSRGQVVQLQEPQLNEAGTEYNDNVVVRFADGTEVPMLTSQNMVVAKDQKSPATKFMKNKQGEELRRLRKNQLAATAARTTGLMRFLDDVRAERAELEEGGNKSGGKVDDLGTGDILFSKDGEPLGPVIDKIPIVGKSGNPGYAIIFEDANGEEQQVRLPAGEVRSPKA